MRFQVDHDLHIHSQLSPCCKNPQQTTSHILQIAAQYNYHTVCLTDHFWDALVPNTPVDYVKLDLPYISTAQPLPQTACTRFLFGCEAEMNWQTVPGIDVSHYDAFDFMVIATTHFHLDGCLAPEKKVSPETRAAAWLERFDKVLSMDLPFHKVGIAHLFTTLIAGSREEYPEILKRLSINKVGTLFEKSASLGIGIELNCYDIQLAIEEYPKIWSFFHLAKECGCQFYLGSDAHDTGRMVRAVSLFEHAVDRLNLMETDKLTLMRRTD